ncbi:L-carnitine dehydratase/bile acid-inducible protein F [Cordyceps militaris CM01]|uniref:L-carnitine dehydratase/bile acid-inducible protein F n=1 Tax=Cordyceps militaris (strain CM01) TaxID=983644 RepID=G3JFA5_CORMM|nr:L-carnitine dehydratase/bile acid-inducible protein F [Cordyceps militaris CM01]EGX93545.1 L-carnitine dehydratase/bile acid-inducible protein F [Cordyceps militaris CM01]
MSLRTRMLRPSATAVARAPISRSRTHASQTQQRCTSSSKQLPLSGVTVVSLEQAIAAPFCTRQLADQGARVIKIERPGVGDFARHYDARVRGLSSHFLWTNRSKESLALDLKRPRDLAAARTIIQRADVLVQNLAPGAAARLGLSHQALRDAHPRLIVCDISGYGAHGPYRDKKAYDLLIQSEAGFVSVTGGPDAPAKAGISIADIAAGMYAYSSILAALIERGRTGCGRRIDISMLESMVEWMGFPLYYAMDGQPLVPRTGLTHATVYPYGPFATAGGGGAAVLFGVQNEREWLLLCRDVLGDEAVATDARFGSNALRSENREPLRAIICDKFAGLPASEVLERLDAAGIANAKVNDMHDVWEHPQLRARGRWAEMDTPAGRVPTLLPPGIDDPDGTRLDAVPAVGQHNESLFAEFGIVREDE